MWKKQWEKISSHENDYLKYQKTVYPLVLGQCSPALRAQLEGTKGFEKINADQDVVELLQMIRDISCRHDQNTDKTYAIVQSLKSLKYFYQRPHVANNEYLKEFKACVETIKDFDACTLGKFQCLVKKKLEKVYNKTIDMATPDEVSKCKDLVKKEVMAALLLSGSDKLCFGGLKSTLAQQVHGDESIPPYS